MITDNDLRVHDPGPGHMRGRILWSNAVAVAAGYFI